MTVLSLENDQPQGNPLDLVEEIVSAKGWAFDRISEDEIAVEISGRWCDYRLYFAWWDDVSAMHFSCALDMRVPKNKRSAVHDLLAMANEKMWLGHFDISSDDGLPMFRHTMLLRGVGSASVEQLDDLMETALSQCERFYPAFQFVIWGGKSATDALAAALLDTAGEA
jgi:hypothetical protein